MPQQSLQRLAIPSSVLPCKLMFGWRSARSFLTQSLWRSAGEISYPDVDLQEACHFLRSIASDSLLRPACLRKTTAVELSFLLGVSERVTDPLSSTFSRHQPHYPLVHYEHPQLRHPERTLRSESSIAQIANRKSQLLASSWCRQRWIIQYANVNIVPLHFKSSGQQRPFFGRKGGGGAMPPSRAKAGNDTEVEEHQVGFGQSEDVLQALN
ncbi:hypothetical protein HYFRA_00009494 [Hymenoscyphus fraxineus]|uniref:Uncharacterized protein n=1 Tax=Hymenoscyphus fraxineus TaxID=746836 RepID=A0A9N9KWB3_9HELO|nr:hypothetical protein HYFRA_00009494 [Hymenoscyphus fraxineus]